MGDDMRLVGTMLVVMVLGGCTIHYVPKPSPEEPIVIPVFNPGQPVAIVNKTAPREVMLSVQPYDLQVGYRQYADSAIQLLKSELEKRGGIVQTSASREIGLDFTDIRIVPSLMRFRAFINFTVTTGDGYVRGLEASDVNGNFQKAIDGAIVNVVKAMLTNDRVRQYLSE